MIKLFGARPVHQDHTALNAYIDGRLDAATTRRLEKHLAVCAECTAEVEELRTTVLWLQQAPQAAMPRSFALNPAQAPSPERPGIAWLRPATAIAGAAFLLLVAVDAQRTFQPTINLSAPSGRAASAPAPSAPVAPQGGQVLPQGIEEGRNATAGMPSSAAAGAPELEGMPSPTPLAGTAEDKATRQAQAPAAALPGQFQPSAAAEATPQRPADTALAAAEEQHLVLPGLKVEPNVKGTSPPWLRPLEGVLLVISAGLGLKAWAEARHGR